MRPSLSRLGALAVLPSLQATTQELPLKGARVKLEDLRRLLAESEAPKTAPKETRAPDPPKTKAVAVTVETHCPRCGGVKRFTIPPELTYVVKVHCTRCDLVHQHYVHDVRVFE